MIFEPWLTATDLQAFVERRRVNSGERWIVVADTPTAHRFRLERLVMPDLTVRVPRSEVVIRAPRPFEYKGLMQTTRGELVIVEPRR